jgi:hypothetical protein
VVPDTGWESHAGVYRLNLKAQTGSGTVASGVYFLSLTGRGIDVSRRIVVVK